MVKNGKTVRLLIILLVFFFAISLRMWNLNKMGRTWDEPFYVSQGHSFIDLIGKGNFIDSLWYKDPDPPAVAKYIYGIADHLDVNRLTLCKSSLCSYDFTSARLASVLFSSLTVVLVTLIGIEYISFSVGIIAGVILSMLPIFLGLSQLVTVESIMIFLFTACVYSFLHFLKTFSIKNMLICGILMGLAIGTKYTNVILIPLLFCIYFLWYFHSNKRIKLFNKRLLFIPFVSLITFFIIWPIPWFHLNEVWQWERSVHFSDIASHPVPEVFFGRLMPVPIPYYFIYFLITTPFLIVLLFLVGLKKISDDKEWILYSLVVWFLVPFIQSFLNMRQNGVRYIIEIYAPLSLISAIGFDFLLNKFIKNQKLKLGLFLLLIVYLFTILQRITPYYLDYFNVIVGGAKGVYQNRMFQLGWWGQGVRGAAEYIDKNASAGSSIGVAISPSHVMPILTKFIIEKYNPKNKYDFVIVNYYNILREGFDDSEIRNNYAQVYSENADGAKLATVYKRK